MGYFQPESGQTSCLAAPNDVYVDIEGAIEATARPPGQATLGEGSASIDDCFTPELVLEDCTIFAVGSAPVFGTSSNDVFCGDDGDNISYALGGNDLVPGFGGNYLIFMGDTGTGSEGASLIFLGQETRWVAFTDQVFGGAGNDRIYGGNGNDINFGGAGDDQLWGQNDDDVLRDGTLEPLAELCSPVYPLPEVLPSEVLAIPKPYPKSP